jgi:hypothetical protein
LCSRVRSPAATASASPSSTHSGVATYSALVDAYTVWPLAITASESTAGRPFAMSMVSTVRTSRPEWSAGRNTRRQRAASRN